MLLTVVSSVTVNGVFHPALDLKRGTLFYEAIGISALHVVGF
jgi:hypothetical protein